jgi:acyl-coenzyme A thioesterase PaaI-like protein
MTIEARSAGSRGAADRARLHPRCVVCGDRHPYGLGLAFLPSADGRTVEAVFDCRETVEGYAGLVHGGVVSMLLDGAMAHCLFHRGIIAHTGELTVRFRQAVLVGREARIRAWPERSRGRVHLLGAELVQDARVKAVATAKFVESAETGEAPAARRTR